MLEALFSNPKVLPTVLIVIDVLAAIHYQLATHDWHKCLYWSAAAAITYSVTY